MIESLADIRPTDDLESLRARLGEALGLDEPVPESALLRAIDDPNYASALLTSRNVPGFLEPLLNDPKNARWERAPTREASDTSDLGLVSQVAGAMLRWGKAGFSLADDETLARREAACLACPRLREPERLIQKLIPARQEDRLGARTGNRVCASCGCQVSKKMRLATESCPEPHPTLPGQTRWQEPIPGRTP